MPEQEQQPQKSTDPYIVALIGLCIVSLCCVLIFGDDVKAGRFVLVLSPVLAVLIARLAAKHDAGKREESTQQQLTQIQQTASAGTAEAVAERFSPKEIGAALLADESFVEKFAEKLVPHLQTHCEDVATNAAKKAIELQRQQDARIQVKT